MTQYGWRPLWTESRNPLASTSPVSEDAKYVLTQRLLRFAPDRWIGLAAPVAGAETEPTGSYSIQEESTSGILRAVDSLDAPIRPENGVTRKETIGPEVVGLSASRSIVFVFACIHD